MLPVACGSERPHLTNMEMARLLLAAVADRGLGNVAATVRDFSALETEGGLQFCDWLEGVVAGRVDAEPIVSIIFQMDPASVSVLTSAAQMDFGAHEDSPTTCITAISGEALRSIIEDFKNGVG
ncbi:hypothetical protein HAP47_0021785 [Bradyrhizobium sp. 41S5]|uniref:hypothetical protein n=1 Tax=Bradyrhizobium sp. 41S5 TaxID=1404443 RepID=UPI00156AFC07|nr:hypothetical protein [Bradyrhizobium sp. 41S5]UFX41931.1 hypothetical protein HAP47_0021785 [Bradyrhizobium sp. 41S5]